METTKPGWALIIAGGKPVKPSLAARLGSPTWIIAADSGLDQANRLGIRPDLVIGDMDSVSPDALAAAARDQITIVRYPEDKDATDLELAIDAATAAGFQRATIIGGTGGRMAHTMANAMLLLQERAIDVDWLTSRARITALRNGQHGTYRATAGPLLSVLAVGAPASCQSTGLKWPLDDNPLIPGSTRGISNEITDSEATVQVISGQALIIHERD
ncbi:MAG: thiamine diphosphokinase [Acidimicrobiia bacterium]|nr:thiamine diphosphokinase [Acidimicrobiia bacterium]MDX2468584.1 thiamine diphosphokinase [Acidimicrobiia bacterium]